MAFAPIFQRLFSATFDRRAAAAASSLLTGIAAYWKLDETSGNRNDSIGTSHLTPVNTPGYEAGKVGNAAAMVRASSHGLYVPSNAALQTGDSDFAFACWCKLARKTTTNHYIVGKGNNNASAWEYVLRYTTSTDRFQFLIANAAASVTANNLGSPSIGSWYFIVCQHDATANTITIQVNDGTANSAADATITANNEPFAVGSLTATSSPFSTLDGAVDEVGLWKRTLTADEKTALYNSGNGITYPFAGT